MLRLFLQYGGNSRLWDRTGFTPMHYAAREGDAGCLLEMLRYEYSQSSTSTSSAGSSSLRQSSEFPDKDSSSSQHGYPTSSSRSDITTKHRIRCSPKAGAYALTERTSQTLLHTACKSGAISVIKLLCRWEGDITSDCDLTLIEDSLGKKASQYLPATVAPTVSYCFGLACCCWLLCLF